MSEYGSEASGVALCRPDDPRLVMLWSESGGFEQAGIGPILIVIGRETTDAKCSRLAERFALDCAALTAFRDSSAMR